MQNESVDVGAQRILRVAEAQSRSLKRYARVGGLLILISLAAGLFGEVYVPSTLSSTTAGTAAAHSFGHEAVMRVGFACYLVEAVCDITLTLILYVLLRPVDRNMALLAALFRVASTAIFGASEFFYLAAMLISGNVGYPNAFSPVQAHALIRLSYAVYGYGSSAPVFYGMAALVTGYLIYRSGFLPRSLGVLWILGGLGQVTNTFALVLLPGYAHFWELVPLLLAMLTLALWFLVRGVDAPKWKDLAASARVAL